VLASRLQVSHARAGRNGVELTLDGTLSDLTGSDLTGSDLTGSDARADVREDLADIIGNLVDNAIEAVSGRDPGGRVRVSLERGADRPGADRGLRISVRDNGGGIAEPVEQAFAPNWTTKGHGRGFGLALVRDKVDRLGGTVVAYNDGGAVFDVHIPEE
jgi:signal transduction histidine kinase